MLIGERYQVERELGKGGFGTTYAALDQKTGERVAVKVLDLRRVGDWKAVELFEREAQVLKKLKHPGIPAYIEFRSLEEARDAYLVQALAPGENLETLLGKRRFSEEDLLDLTERVLDILDYLTRQHPVVIHRDIKPQNILLDTDGKVSLVDFGAVRDVASATIGGGSTVAGTFGYMAPEQLQGVAVPSSDLYGLGMTLIHLATGRVPSDFEEKRLKPDFKPHAHLSPAFEEFIDKLIEPIPDDRFPNAAAALSALRKLGKENESRSLPSAEEISRLRERHERKAMADLAKQAAATPPPPKKGHERTRFTEDEEGATLEILPAPYWRGRGAHFAFVVIFGAFPVSVMAESWGGMGVLVGLVGLLLTGWLIWATAPTWKLRVTRSGDFLFYARSPRSPKWVGRANQLKIENILTARGDRMVTLEYKHPSRGPQSRHFYPLSPADTPAFANLTRFGVQYKMVL